MATDSPSHPFTVDPPPDQASARVPEPTPAEQTAFGAALTGQYTIEREIGRGGMGVVYLARDIRLDRAIAIKTLPAHLASDLAVRERFLREARTAGALSHPNIVPIHRADELAGHVFFVMGYVDGESLAQRVRAGGPLPPGDVLSVLRDVALALGYAHANRVVHRDVKAENILLDRRSGRAMVTDFGIARVAEAAPLTATGHVLGSVHYMSPEQVAGEPVDGRSDIYALGVVGYFASSGRFPFESDTASAVLVSHITKPTPSLRTVAPHLPASVVSIIDRCLAKRADERFATAGELAQALDDARGHLDPATASTPRPTSALPAIISETEAQAIWQRASELQVATGGHLPPPIARTGAAHEASLSSGYRVADVRSAALEAGIAPQHVEQVLAERGLVAPPPSGRAPRAPAPRVLASKPASVPARARSDPDETPRSDRRNVAPRHPDAAAAIAHARGEPSLLVREIRHHPINAFLGISTRMSFDATIDGEMPVADYDLLVDIIQRRLGEVGQIGAVGRALSWTLNLPKRKTQVSIVPRHGRTAIHVEEDLTPLAGMWFGGVLGGGGGGFGAMATGVIMALTREPAAAIGAWLAVIASAYFSARGFLSRAEETRRTQLRSLVERLTEQISESIDPSRGPDRDPSR
jgi:serine/threonine-protein kinase